VGATKRVTLAPQQTAIIEALNAGSLSEGYATFSLPSGVTGYGVNRQSVAGIPDQEALVGFKDASTTATSFTWDDTNFITALAFANPSTVSVTATITAWDSTGALVGTGTLVIPAGTKVANTMRAISGLGGIVGLRGTALVTVPTGNLAVLGLRFGGAAFTSIPTTEVQ
jgi:YD repeat-containing protein